MSYVQSAIVCCGTGTCKNAHGHLISLNAAGCRFMKAAGGCEVIYMGHPDSSTVAVFEVQELDLFL
jgi:hypothetical protein